MKVLMVNTPASAGFKGGDTVQMVKTAAELRLRGLTVHESCDAEPRAKGFDIAHVFNLRTLAATRRQVAALAAQGIPVVMSPIYLNPSVALWSRAALQRIFSGDPDPERIAKGLAAYKARDIPVKTKRGTVWRATSPNRTSSNYDEVQRRILDKVAYLLPNSHLEQFELQRTLRVSHIPFRVVPYGADPLVFMGADPAPFVERTGLRDFVLQVGRIEASKNQLMTAIALRDRDYPLVFIGSSKQRNYLEWCRRHGPKNLVIIPHLPQEQLASAYAAARVHVLPSWIETCGLVTMEAALAGCSIVGSVAGFEVEYFRGFARYCDPADPASIAAAVDLAYTRHEHEAQRRVDLKRLILTEYTWERAAELVHRSYLEVLRDGNRRRE